MIAGVVVSILQRFLQQDFAFRTTRLLATDPPGRVQFLQNLVVFLFVAARREKKPCTWLLGNHSSLVNSRLFCASLALRIWLETCRGSALRPVCSPRSNFTVKHFFTLSVNMEGPALGLTNAQLIQTAGSNGHRSC